jgi:hypothetical protein
MNDHSNTTSTAIVIGVIMLVGILVGLLLVYLIKKTK